MNVQQAAQQSRPPKKIRVVLADDHREFVATVRTLLDEEFEVIQVVENGREAVDAVRKLDPDVLVTDVSMPVLDGFQTARAIQQTNCRTKVVFLTIHEGRDFIAAAFSAGGAAYVTKQNLSTDLALAIHESLKGHTFVSNSIRS
jgi:DNA-binding NarL/FixJ family response regulator